MNHSVEATSVAPEGGSPSLLPTLGSHTMDHLSHIGHEGAHQMMTEAPAPVSNQAEPKSSTHCAPHMKVPHSTVLFVQCFTPSWFTVNMGTGIVSILIHNLPYSGSGLYWIAVVIFVTNLLLFVLLTILSVVRYTTYPGLLSKTISHPVVPLFLGAFPMGLATIIEMIALVCGPTFGSWAVYLAWGLWWFDAVISLGISFGLPFLLMSMHNSKPAHVTALWLLPMASSIVASAAGAVVAEALPEPSYAAWTLVTSYVLWGAAMPLSMSFLVVYLYRLLIHQLPARNIIVSCLIPVAPLGQGAFAMIQMGRVADVVAGHLGLGGEQLASATGRALYAVGWLSGLLLWGYGLTWLLLALGSLTRAKFPFNLGWWAFTFPLGVWTSAATALGQDMQSPFFRIIGSVFTGVVIVLWLVVSLATVRGVYQGNMNVAPDFDEWRKERALTKPTDAV